MVFTIITQLAYSLFVLESEFSEFFAFHMMSLTVRGLCDFIWPAELKAAKSGKEFENIKERNQQCYFVFYSILIASRLFCLSKHHSRIAWERWAFYLFNMNLFHWNCLWLTNIIYTGIDDIWTWLNNKNDS